MPTDSSSHLKELAYVRRARIARDRADAEFRSAVYRASAEGHSLRTIAAAACLSHVRVLNIVREHSAA